MEFRLATFNVENLFVRLDFNAFTDERAQNYLPAVAQFYAQDAAADGDLSRFEAFKAMLSGVMLAQADDKRQFTAAAMAEADAHLFCMQEVDNINALMRFHDAYLKKAGAGAYAQKILFEGNDRRGIDVAALARDERAVMSRSHAWLTPSWFGNQAARDALIEAYPLIKSEINKRRAIFSRDCLEMEYAHDGKRLTVFNCHFKSMSGGRNKSLGKRQLEALAVKRIIQNKFADPAAENWVVVGDMNDYRQQIKVTAKRRADGSYVENLKTLGADDPSGVDPLLDDGFGVNALDALDATARWTHYYPGDRTKTQLDYMIVSPALNARIKGKPQVIRSGQPYRVPNSDEIQRYPRIGMDRPKASDHCPVAVTFKL
ncbi:endonuclease/exonuclease/phosphatase family protein [Magnetofaba australis]|uniref:Putative endonuclease/exonuclease/phosphatase n=1 Tax=Magnetofaba australis IT-1 TaxID=1434232 RepID=A0A1Y2K6U4_9PROT|nr:hypothetical protein [Magnetofaba australis]OSM05068.1 putative endonuclease/exonuclease/phosphatase [Magnetofaba australis IT-1]